MNSMEELIDGHVQRERERRVRRKIKEYTYNLKTIDAQTGDARLRDE
jgi:hypothetical protein